MQTNMLKYEVQRIDGTPASIMQAIHLILSHFTQNPEYKLSKSVEENFFREAHLAILNWIAEKDGLVKMQGLRKEINELTKGDEILLAPFAGVGYKYRFAARLSCMCDLLEIYLGSETYTKDYIEFTLPENVHTRDLVVEMWKLDSPATENEVLGMVLSTGATRKDLEYLLGEHFVRKNELDEIIYFELTPKAFVFMDRLKLK